MSADLEAFDRGHPDEQQWERGLVAPSTEAIGEVRRRVEQVLGDLDVDAIAEKWLRQCGSCDAGLPEYGCSHPDEDHRPTMLRLVEEVRRLRMLVGSVTLYGTGYRWRRSDGEVLILHPADVDVFLSADQVTEVEKLRSDLAAMTSERDAARADLLAYADAAAIADDDHTCEVCEVATELAEERTLHQQTIAERDRWKSRASKEHVQELTLERDQARAELESAWENLAIVEGNLKSVIEHVKGERDAAVRNWVGVQDEFERALPVVEAAKAWRTAAASVLAQDVADARRHSEAAVDAYTTKEASDDRTE